MGKDKIIIDIDALYQQILGASALLESLQHADFQVRLMMALGNDPGSDRARQEFREVNLNFLRGSIDICAGLLNILSEGLMNGSLKLDFTEEEL